MLFGAYIWNFRHAFHTLTAAFLETGSKQWNLIKRKSDGKSKIKVI